MAKTKESITNTSQNTHMAVQPESRERFISRIIKTIFYGVWAVVGLLVAILLVVAMFGGGTLLQSLSAGSSTPAAGQAPAGQQQQPPQPTEDQLGCVRKEVGDDRFEELQKGGTPADEKENTAIQKCLQS